MAVAQLHLSFPVDLERERTVSTLRTTFSVHLNILRANVEPDGSWFIVELTAEEAEIERAVAWLREQGVEVGRIPTG